LVALFSSLAWGADTEIAASKDATFRRANDAYFHGRYQEAVDAYEQVAALGVVSDDLFYNLGNAYLKAGQLGPAIYNYERALELDPSQDDARFNLGVAREAARKKGEDRLAGVEAQPLWMRIAGQVTVNWASWLFLGLYVALFTLLIVLHFVQPGFLRVGMWAGLAFLGLATLVGGALLGARLYLADRVEQAIVLPDVVQVKEGPDPNYQAVFGVHAGLRVRVTEKEQDWVRIRLANGLEGWVRRARPRAAVMELRRARREDVAAIVALYADDFLGAARETPAALDGYYAAFDEIARDPSHELIVAERDGRLVGTFQLTFIRHLSHGGSRVAQVEAVRIAADLRGQGLGGEMMRWAIARARAAGCVRMQLTSNKERPEAHRFYERLGFRRSHEGFKLYF
jgi:GNAT superfamily N-acetyltransferase